MFEAFRDPGGRARAAIAAARIWVAADVANALSALYTIWALEGLGPLDRLPDYDRVDTIEGAVAIVFLIAFAVSIVLVARWIMQVNGNAQQWSDGVTITPGWNVGWFFVPIASLFKPFQGIRETWQASVDPDQPETVDVPGVMRAWWGCFLAMNIVGNISFRLGLKAETAEQVIIVRWIDIATLLVDIPAAMLLIVVIRRLTAIQQQAASNGHFAGAV